MWAAAAVLAAAAVGLSLLWWESQRVDGLLAEAYTEERPFDFRLADRGYAPAVQQRGTGSPLSKPPALREAEARISRLKNRDVAFLKWQGDIDLLEMSPDDAVAPLTEAHTQAPEDPEATVGLAIAYALRGDLENSTADYGFALDLLSGEVRLHPNGLRASFNRALVCERLQMVPEAIRQWNAYLKLDGSSKWADEARARLKQLNSRHGKRQDMLRQAAEDESSFLASASPQRPDEFLDRTAIAWLADTPRSEIATEAVKRLAGLMLERSGDRWLTDALPEAGRSGAASQLLAVIDLNAHGRPDDALEEASKLAPAWQRRGALALAARLRAEQVYAFHRSLRSQQCVPAARALQPELERHAYRWLEIQNRLELAVCMAAQGQEGEAIGKLEDDLRVARADGFSGLALRASGLLADTRALVGGAWGGWNDSVAGLAMYWQTGAPPNRAHQFFFNLALSAERLGLRLAAFDFGRAAVEEFSFVDNLATQELGDSRVATFAMNAGLPAEAATFFDSAAADRREARNSPTAVRYHWEAELARIQSDLETGRLDEARRRLPMVDTANDPAPSVVAIQFRRELLFGLLSFRSADLVPARQHLERAVALADARLASLQAPLERQRALDEAGRAVKGLMLEMFAEGQDSSRILGTWLAFRYSARRESTADVRLVYVVLDGRIAAWLSDAGGVRFRWLGQTPARLAALTTQLMNLESDPHSDRADLERVSRTLSTALLGPWDALLANKRKVLVMEDDEMAPVPFALLPAGDGRLLGEAHPVVHCVRSAEEKQPLLLSPAGTALVVTASHSESPSGQTLPPLMDARAEGRSVADRFDGGRLLEEAAATPAAIKTIAPEAELFHFSGHGFSQGGEGALGLQSSLLGAAEIAGMDWRQCRLAVLSACLTAPGESHGVVNPDSLVRAFLASGARNVVAAAWSVDSRATRLLMEAFYSYLITGSTPAAALEAAQTVLRRTPGFAHPYYWGAFELYE